MCAINNYIKKNKVSVISHCVIFFILFALLAIASVYDLQISKAISNNQSFFGAFFAVVGEVPAYIVLPISSVVFFYCDLGKSKAFKVLIKIVFLIICFAGFLIWFFSATVLEDVTMKSQFAIVYSAIFTVIFLTVGKPLLSGRAEKFAKIAVFAVVVMATTFLVIRIMKGCWGRMRFRDMVQVGNFDGFTPWYKPNGYIKGDFTSFPSGHTSSAANIFIVVPLCKLLVKKRKVAIAAICICTVFTVLTGISRVVFLAHFLSDVVVGGIVSYIIYVAMYKVFFKGDNFEFCRYNNLESNKEHFIND